MAKLIDLKLKMARILSLGSWQNDTNGLVGIVNEAYQLGREERDAELAAEVYNGTSILRDPAAVVDVSQSPIGDKPQGDAWMDGD